MIRCALLLALAIAVTSCGPSDRPIWLAGLGGTAFPMMPRHLSSDEDVGNVLPTAGQTFHIFTGHHATTQATVVGVELEPENCMNAVSLAFEHGWPESLFFLASSKPIASASTSEIPLDEPGLVFGLREYLQAHGIYNPALRILRAMSADIGGERRVVAVAEQVMPSDPVEPRHGDFSMVAVGRYLNGYFQVEDVIGVVVADPAKAHLPSQFGLLGLPDFDGDGKFEVAIWEIGYEWTTVSVYSMSQEGLLEEGTASCGS